jgi:hypothetical protein
VFAHACNLCFEGIVSTRKSSPYRSGRSPGAMTERGTKQQLRKNDSARMRARRLKKNALTIYQHPMPRTQICNSAERLTTTGAPHGGR